MKCKITPVGIENSCESWQSFSNRRACKTVKTKDTRKLKTILPKEKIIRKSIETTIETILAASLDDVSIHPKLTSSKHIYIFLKYHETLSSLVETMFRSMQESLSHEEDYKPLTTSSYDADDELKTILEDAVRDSLDQKSEHPIDDFERDVDHRQEFGSCTYEDILATAVLNKVLEKCNTTSQDFGEIGSLEHGGGTDTDSGLSGSIRGDALKRMGKNLSEGASEGSSSPPCESPKETYSLAMPSKIRSSPTMLAESPDIGVGFDGGTFDSSDIVWNFGNDGFSPLQFKIEEHIEEVTTHRLTDEESAGSYNESENDSAPDGGNQSASKISKQSQAKSTFRKSRYATKISTEEAPQVLPPLVFPSISAEDIEGPSRIPFPELGVDLLQDSLTTTDGGPSEFLLDNSDWKENWLFMKETSRDPQTIQTGDTITMLIPNPSSMINPTIGDRDIDELSELSDRHSNYSFDTSSEDEDESLTSIPAAASKDLVDLVGEINAEFGQQDQEYTEDVSALDRLQMTNPYSKNSTGTNSNTLTSKAEMTGVTPVYKSGNRTSTTQYHPKYQSSKRNTKTFDVKVQSSRDRSLNVSKMFKPNIILTPPEVIPQVIDNAVTSSSSVWFESVPEDVVVPIGRALRLSCQVHSRQICGVSWYFEEGLLAAKDDVLIWKKGDTYHLNIFGMGDTKVGTYFVGAYTKDDCVWSKCEVTCVDQGRTTKIPRITLALSDVTAERSSDVFIECQVAGHPEPKVTFMRNSIPLSPSSGDYFIENDQYGSWTLAFREVKDTDAGQIKVIASNSLGHAMSFCNFKVIKECEVEVIKEGEVRVIREGEDYNASFNGNRSSEAMRNIKNKKNFSSELNNSRARTNRSAKTNIHNDINSEHHSGRFNTSLTNSSTEYSSQSLNFTDNYNDYTHNIIDYDDDHNITINGCMFQPPKPGTIAEREHRKWLEAKPLANNPYSPEKLVDRLGKSPHRFPSLPTVYRDTSGDECTDPSLRDLLSSHSDLSRYSRDYHINESKVDTKHRTIYYNAINKKFDVRQEQPRSSTNLVKIESKISDNWKEELKDIKLDVGKKVADIQKTIDAYQYEWQQRLQQRGWNPTSCGRHGSLKRNNQKLSASCINLHTPPKTKTFSGSGHRHLVYSSTEILNRDQSQNNLWRTVSVDTLNPPFKYSFPTSEHSTLNQRYDNKDVVSTNKDSVERRYSCPPLSDSDDSSNLNKSFYNNKQMETNSYFHQNGYNNRRMTSYYSENSIESLKEESDTEDSLPVGGDNSNLPSVKELTNKFDSLKSLKNKTTTSKRHHEKLRSTRSKDVVIIEQNDQNNSIGTTPYNINSRKYSDKFIVNEVRIGGKPTKIYGSNINRNYPRLPYRFDGPKERPVLQNFENLRGTRVASLSSPSSEVNLENSRGTRVASLSSLSSEMNLENSRGTRVASLSSLSSDVNLENFRGTRLASTISSPSSEVFTPTDKDCGQFVFDDVQYSDKYRNRFSTSELMKADEFWGSGGTFNLSKMRNLSASTSSMAESDISIATLPVIPDSTSKDINDLFGIKLRTRSGELSNRHIYKSSSSDIFPISKLSRPKSAHDFRKFPDLSDEENSDSMGYCDPVIARRHNLPKFYANVTTKPQKQYTLNFSRSLHDLSRNEHDPLPNRDYNAFPKSGAFSLDRTAGSRMYNFLKKYENKKSLEDIPSFVNRRNEPAKFFEETAYSGKEYESTMAEETAKSMSKTSESAKFVEETIKYSNKKFEPAKIDQVTREAHEKEDQNNFSIPMRPKFKKRGSMHDFLKMYSNRTTLPTISNSGEVKLNEKSIEQTFVSKDSVLVKTDYSNFDETASMTTKNAFYAKAEMQMSKDEHEEMKLKTSSMLESNVTSGPSEVKRENVLAKSKQSVTEVVPIPPILEKKTQVSTLYASVNKPSIKPKPESLTNPKRSTKEKSASIQQMDKKLIIPSSRTLSSENLHDQQTKVSKYHITPNHVYTRYLHNYSNMRSLKEKGNYVSNSANFESDIFSSDEQESLILHKEVQTEPVRKVDDGNQRERVVSPTAATSLKSPDNNNRHLYKSTMTRNEVFSQGTNVTIKIDVQPINRQVEVENESTQTSFKIDVIAGNDTKTSHYIYGDNEPGKEYKLNEDENNDEGFQKENKQRNEVLNASNKEIKGRILVDKEVVVPNESQSRVKVIHIQNKPSLEARMNTMEETNISKTENMSPIEATVNADIADPKEDADSSNILKNNAELLKDKTEATVITPNSEYVLNQSNGLTHDDFERPHIVKGNESTEANTSIYYRRSNSRPILLDVDDDSDPLSLTKRIIRGARYSTSGLVGSSPKYDISQASLPERSPFIYKPRRYENIE